MLKAYKFQRSKTARPTPASSQAFVTTPSPRCFEKVVTKRSPGLGGRVKDVNEVKNDFGKRTNKTRNQRGKQKKVRSGIPHGSVIECFLFQPMDFAPLVPCLEGTDEALRASPIRARVPGSFAIQIGGITDV